MRMPHLQAGRGPGGASTAPPVGASASTSAAAAVGGGLVAPGGAIAGAADVLRKLGVGGGSGAGSIGSPAVAAALAASAASGTTALPAPIGPGPGQVRTGPGVRGRALSAASAVPGSLQFASPDSSRIGASQLGSLPGPMGRQLQSPGAGTGIGSASPGVGRLLDAGGPMSPSSLAPPASVSSVARFPENPGPHLTGRGTSPGTPRTPAPAAGVGRLLAGAAGGHSLRGGAPSTPGGASISSAVTVGSSASALDRMMRV